MKNIGKPISVIENLTPSIKEHKNKKEAIAQLEQISLSIKELKTDIDLDFYYELLNTNPTLKKLLKTIVGNVTSLTRSRIEDISNNCIIQTMIETYCNTLDIVISEDEIIEKKANSQDVVFCENQSALNTYLHELSYPLLTREEELELLTKIKNGDTNARKKLIERNLKLVVHIAKRYQNPYVSIEDLIGEGNIGLIQAIKYYDLEKKSKFSTYAAFWIRAAITRSIKNNKNNIRVSIRTQSKLSKYHRVKTKLEEKLGRTPTIKEISEQLKISEQEILKLESYNRTNISLSASRYCNDAENTNEKAIELEEIIFDPEGSLEEKMIKSELKNIVIRLLKDSNLNTNEMIVIVLKYGMINDKVYSYKKIGEIIGVSRQRIEQIENTALQKLRENSKTKNLAIYLDNPDEGEKKIDYFRQFKGTIISTKGLVKKYEKGETPPIKTKKNKLKRLKKYKNGII